MAIVSSNQHSEDDEKQRHEMRSRERSWSENVDIIEIIYVGIHNN
jgi:hypothetical protein